MSPIRTLAALTAAAALAFAPSTAAAGGAKGNIVAAAMSSTDHQTLVAAVKAAGLVDTLASKGPFTVFAPTDAAFAKLPPGTVEMLLKPENKARLRSILTYHVVAGSYPAAKVVELTSAKTVNGQNVSIDASRKGVKVAGVSVVQTDIQASNGVIHVIDSVMLPEEN